MIKDERQRQASGDGDKNMQIQAGGDVNGPFVGPDARFEGVHVGGHNSGSITITAVKEPGQPEQEISIKRMRRLPAPASVIGVVSGVITIGGAITGYFSVKDFISAWQAGSLNSLAGVTSAAHWWLIGSVFIVFVGVCGFAFFSFLRKHVLWLPRWAVCRARAGIRLENGQTYAYSLRLAAQCVECGSKMNFFNKPMEWVDHYEGHKRTGRTVTERLPVAQCGRNPKRHWVEIDIARNDFDSAVSR
ncbi:hypothetical protein [Arthrobacter sp. NA-172]|uniref:hypothetical protein n=1 Tax=Arthrobacter sp. NA-172 TaxID=3367524 RepID=UPI003755110B